jgi:hypothetical protein
MRKHRSYNLAFSGLVMTSVLQVLCACHNDRAGAALDKLKDAADLASAEFVIGKTIIADQSKKVLGIIPLNDAVFFAQSQAVVKTGVDLSQLNPGDVKIENGKTIILQLPPVEVISFNYPPESIREIKEYTHLHTFDNRITAGDMDQMLQQAQDQVMEGINHLDIRRVTEDKMRNLLTGLLRQEGFEQVFVTFRKSDRPLMITGE